MALFSTSCWIARWRARWRWTSGECTTTICSWSGTDRRDLSAAYTPVRTQLKPGGVTWILGAAGPMGQMHLLRALSLPGRPAKIVATNLHARRMEPVRRQLARQAAASGVDLVYFSNDEFADDDAFSPAKRVETGGRGYDDIAIMAPTVAAIEQASEMTQRMRW
jgi:threonine dehydrogenase-like Zn-dependent dehydrogenase